MKPLWEVKFKLDLQGEIDVCENRDIILFWWLVDHHVGHAPASTPEQTTPHFPEEDARHVNLTCAYHHVWSGVLDGARGSMVVLQPPGEDTPHVNLTDDSDSLALRGDIQLFLGLS